MLLIVPKKRGSGKAKGGGSGRGKGGGGKAQEKDIVSGQYIFASLQFSYQID